ncbi:MAG TPA: hypothetical protein VI589_00930, partial [Vicinamibacteria bacterium]
VFTTLMGLLDRKHIRAAWSFAFYLAAVFVTDALMLLDRFDTLAFWLRKEVVLSALKFAIAFEIITRAFGRFPGAKATAHRIFWLIVVMTVVSTIWVAASWDVDTTGLTSREVAARVTSDFHPRVVTAITWLFVAIAGLILWYRLPVESMPKAILIGFVPYLLFSYLMVELRTANHWPTEGWITRLDTWVYLLLLGYWARSAWQPFREIMPAGRQPVPVVQGQAG